MKLRTSWIFCSALLLIALSACQEDGKRPRKEKADVPRFKSQDWSKAYNFKEVNKLDAAEKKNLSITLFKEAWIANDVSAGMLIAQHGKVIYENYRGWADKSKFKKLGPHTPLHIASTSKVMTAVVILKLVEDKKLDLDEKVSRYLKGFPYTDVTIRHLMSHRSGLPNYLYFTSDPKVWDSKKVLTNRDVLDIMIKDKPEIMSKAGTHFSYNNTNYVLLALLIEKASKMPYPQAMKYILFEPIGMKNTFVFNSIRDSSKVSKSYYNNGRPWQWEYLDATYGDKNIYSTPRDMFLLDCAMYSEDFLPEELKKQAIQGYSYEKDGIKNYGLGIRMMEFPDGGKFLYHNGWWHGNNTVYVRDYKHEAVIIAFGNKKTRSVYAPFSLVTMFGNYALPVDSSVLRQQDSLKRIQERLDSLEKWEKSEKSKLLEQDTSLPIPKNTEEKVSAILPSRSRSQV